MNLLSNAVKFTPKGGQVTLRCRLERTAPGRLVGVFDIRDTGIGISRAFLPHVFEPFAQETPSDRRVPGSGLGLAIVKNMTEVLGGTVGVQSVKGSGTDFTVRLPLEECALPEPSGAENDRSSELAGRCALVCEDNELNMEIFCTILQNAGMEVIRAENGQLGVSAFADAPAGHIDVVLLDIRMPVMDGLAAARAIRALVRPDAKAVPIFAVSADAFAENAAEARAAGMNGHISKPIDAAVLLNTLADAIKQ